MGGKQTRLRDNSKFIAGIPLEFPQKMVKLVQILLLKVLAESGKIPLPMSERVKTDSITGQNGRLSN